MGPEAKVKNLVRDLLKSYGVYWFMPIGGAYSSKGTPDFVCCVNGKFFSIETKAPGKKPTKLQEKCMKEIRDSGGRTFVVSDGVGIIEVKQFIEEAINGAPRKRASRVPKQPERSVEDVQFWSDPITAR